MSTSFFYGIQMSPHVIEEFHVKVALLTLPAHHLLIWRLHVLHVSFYEDHEKTMFHVMLCEL